MAERRITQLVDDLDGSPAVATVRLSYQGTDYEIDLSRENAADLYEALAPYLTAARLATRSKRRQPVPGRTRATHGDQAEARAWARQQGYQVSQRGRLPEAVLAAYKMSR